MTLVHAVRLKFRFTRLPLRTPLTLLRCLSPDKVFDILYIKGKNGESQCLLDKPLWRRKLLLSQVIKQKTGVIEIADCAKAKSKQEIHAFLVRILEER